jgi:pimeloyl-ACP methyl ester carboxylesterase
MGLTHVRDHTTGVVENDDVEIFYRRFGAPGSAPILILHGAGYYDSADWIDIAAELAGDEREVVAFDARGYGRSSWSASANYSIDAHLSDLAAVTDHLEVGRAEYVEIDSGHDLANEAPAQLIAAVRGFLSRSDVPSVSFQDYLDL